MKLFGNRRRAAHAKRTSLPRGVRTALIITAVILLLSGSVFAAWKLLVKPVERPAISAPEPEPPAVEPETPEPSVVHVTPQEVEPEPQPEEELPPEPPRKRHKRIVPLFVKIILYVVIVAVVSVGAGYAAWACATDVLAFGRSSDTIQVTVPENASLDAIADMLHDNGLIQYPWLFKLYCKFTHSAGRMDAGTYELAYNYDYHALVSGMTESGGTRTTVRVMLPEGATCAQIFALLEEKGVSTVEQLEETAANYDFKFSFLKGVVPLGDPKRLEGYLFPDTYEFYMGEEPVSVLNKMILRFDEIFTDEMRQEVQNDGRTIQDVVTVASMIEKETDGSDQAKIASVIYNRLDNPTSETAGYLNIDATILYATGGTEVDLNADTPYNTRTHKGLTPTAIASPGVDALKAAVYPDSTRYYFYALGDDGKHHFFATYREQQNFIASQERYQNG